ncbi:MAG: DUF2232 domain-containing protein, partial [Candidatus Competibacterales bacterium]|nr:DUF2232 domain-containing protein [Candidatus Competibacterales bacterium]
ALLAATFGVLTLLVPPLALVGAAIIALVTLRLGPWPGLRVALLGGLGCGLLGWLLAGTPVPGLVLALGYWLPVMLLAAVLRASISLALTLQLAAGLGALGVLTFYVVLGDPAAWWRGLTGDMLDQMNRAGVISDPGTLEALRTVFDIWAPLAPGQLVFSLLLALLLALFLARWWQAILYNPGGFRQEFHALRLGRPLATLMAAMIGLTLLLNWPLIVNLTLVLGLLYLIQGIALVHGLVGRTGLATPWLVALYAGLIFVPVLWQVLLVLGVVDAWVDFRTRLGPSGP